MVEFQDNYGNLLQCSMERGGVFIQQMLPFLALEEVKVTWQFQQKNYKVGCYFYNGFFIIVKLGYSKQGLKFSGSMVSPLLKYKRR